MNDNIKTLLKFMPVSQSILFIKGLHGSESRYFESIATKISKIITNAPTLYETDGQGDSVKPVLHYFWACVDIFVTEIDKTNGEHFGYTSLGHGFLESGYINLKYIFNEIPLLNLDFNFKPKTIHEYKKIYQG